MIAQPQQHQRREAVAVVDSRIAVALPPDFRPVGQQARVFHALKVRAQVLHALAERGWRAGETGLAKTTGVIGERGHGLVVGQVACDFCGHGGTFLGCVVSRSEAERFFRNVQPFLGMAVDRAYCAEVYVKHSRDILEFLTC